MHSHIGLRFRIRSSSSKQEVREDDAGHAAVEAVAPGGASVGRILVLVFARVESAELKGVPACVPREIVLVGETRVLVEERGRGAPASDGRRTDADVWNQVERVV